MENKLKFPGISGRQISDTYEERKLIYEYHS